MIEKFNFMWKFAITVIISIVFQSILCAQDCSEVNDTYQNLFTENKSWKMWHGTHSISVFGDNEFAVTDAWIDVVVVGFETFDGHNCALLKIDVDFAKGEKERLFDECAICDRLERMPEYIYAYEDNAKIYIHRNPGPRYENGEDNDDDLFASVQYGDPYFDSYFDFSVSEGEKVNLYGRFEMNINPIEFIDYGGSLRRVISCNDEAPLFGNKREWIEGIGSNCNGYVWEPYWDFLQPISVITEKFCLATCSENGRVIYNQLQNMQEHGIYVNDIITEVRTVNGLNSEDSCDDKRYYNLQGIPVYSPEAGNVYICNGKKIAIGK